MYLKTGETKLSQIREMEGISVCKKSSKLGKKDDLYHVIHKVPYGDSPYVKAKHAQVYMLLPFSIWLHFSVFLVSEKCRAFCS